MKTSFYNHIKDLMFLFMVVLNIQNGLAQNQCCNVLTNGDFESGFTEFTSGLPLNCACTASSFCLGPNFQSKCGGWPNLTDNTSGSGNFLIVDGSISGPVDVWQYATTINAGKTYCISFWVANVYNTPFDLGVTVNGTLVPGAQFTVPGGAAWAQHSITWTPSSAGTNIAIRQLTGGGQRDFGIDDIKFGQGLKANFAFSPTAACGMSMQFISQSTGPTPLNYSWNFGDPNSPGNTSTQQNPVHTFTDCDEFEVCLTITYGGCTDVICQLVSVADFVNPTALCLGVGVELDVNCMAVITPNMIDGGSFDDCFIASMSVSPSIITGCGFTPVTLTVTDSCGNSSSCTVEVQSSESTPPDLVGCPQNTAVVGVLNSMNVCTAQVPLPPAPTATDVCSPPVSLTNDAPTSGIYPAGTTTVTWTAVDACNNTATCSFTVNVSCDSCACDVVSTQNLIANGNFSQGNVGFTSGLAFDNGAGCLTGTYGINSSFNAFCSGWLPTPANSPPNFLVIDGSNASGSTVLWQSPVNLLPNMDYCFSFYWALGFPHPQQNFPISIDVVDVSGNVVAGGNIGSVTVNSTAWTNSSFTWGSGLLTGAYSIVIRQLSGDIYRDFGIDDICFTKVGATINCTADISVVSEICGKVTFDGYANGTPSYIYMWDFGDNSGIVTTTSSTSPSSIMHQYSSNGNFTVTLVIIDATGCSASYSTVVTISNVATVSITPNPASVCSGSPITPTATGNSGGTYSWSPGGSTNPSITVTPTPSSHNYTVVFTNASNCTATATVNVVIKPLPAFLLFDQFICPGDNATLTAAGGGTYSWMPNGQTTASILVAPTITTVYTATVTGTNGCTGSASATVFVSSDDLIQNLNGSFEFTNGADDGSLVNIDGNIISGATLISGHDGTLNSAYAFNRNLQQWINCGKNTRGVVDAVSVCAWVKTSEMQKGLFIAGQYDGLVSPFDHGYLLAIGDNNNTPSTIGKVAFSGRDGTNTYHSSGLSPIPVNDDVWHCLVGTAGTNGWKIYVDGSIQSSSTPVVAVNTLTTSVNPFTIGRNSDPYLPYMWMNGYIDNVRLYNRQLNDCEVESICTVGFVSIDELSKENPIHIYPNPTTGSLTVELFEPATSDLMLRIIDLSGRIVLEQQTETGGLMQSVEASTLPNGLYFLQTVSQNRIAGTSKFVKH